MAPPLKGQTLVNAVDHQAWRAATKASEIAADPVLRAYAPLFENAVQFWRDLSVVARNDWPMSRDQRFALDFLAAGGGRQ